MKTKIKSKLLSILLVLIMVLVFVPVSALTAFAAEPTEITEIKSVISAEHVPKAGMEVDLFIPNVPDGEPYSRPWSGAEWYDSNGVKIAPTVNHHYDLGYEFEAGHTYYADYQYTASDGYVFAENPIITLTGPDPSMFTYEIIDRWDNNESVTVRYTFTIPGEFENADINKVSMMYYGLPKDGGKKPDRCNVIYNNCTITSEEWNTGTWGSDANWGVYTEDGSNAPTFLAGNTYVHMIELTAKDGYKFSAGLHVQKGTQDAEEYGVVTLSDDRTVATVKFTYEIPSVEIINTIELVAANQHMNFCLRSGESIYLPQPFVPKYVFSADCPYEVENVNSCDWINDETGKYLEKGYPQTFENAKKYTLRFHVRIKDEFETTHKFASGTDLGLNVTDYAYANSSFVDFKVSGGETTATVEVTFTVQFPEGAGSSAGNPAFCYSYEEFKYAMESPNIRYVALGNVDDMLPMIPHDEEQEPDGITRTAILVRGHKDLNLLGDAVFRCPLTGNYDLKYYIQLITLTDAANSSLYIHGPGSLTYAGGTLNFVNSVIKVEGGNLCVDGTTIRGSNGYHTAFCYGINALYGSVSIQGGATVIGEVYGGDDGICAMAVGEEGETRSLSVSIFDGKFYVERDTGDGSVDHGITVWNDCGLRIYGMTSDGIRLGRYAADTLDEYVANGYAMTVNGVKTDPATCGTTNGYVEVYTEISEVEIYVETPVAGEGASIYPEHIYWVPEGCTVESIVWYENGALWNVTNGGERFEAGNSYRVEVTLVADNGVRFADPLTSAEISYKTATVNAHGGNAKKGIVISVDFGACPNVVPEVNLTVTAPQEGNTLSYTVGCDSDAYYAVGGSSNYTDYRAWYESDTGYDNWREMSPGETFTAGKYYKFVTDVYTNPGYEFPLYDNGVSIMPSVSAYINGYAANVSKGYEQDPSRYITVEYFFGICNDSVVESITITNIDAPVAGQTPDYLANCFGTGYSMAGSNSGNWQVNGIVWLRDGDNYTGSIMDKTEKFQAGHVYTVLIDLVPDYGYTFLFNHGNSIYAAASINGNTAQINLETCSANQYTIWYTFTCGAKTVDKVAITDLENPVAGNTPDTTVTVGDSDSYTVERVEWFDIEDNPAAETFESGVPYYALITVAPATGAVFADAETIDVTVNGSELDSVEIKDGKLLIYVIIRKPSSAPIVNPYVFTTQPTGGTLTVGETLTAYWQTTFIPTDTEIQYWDGEAWDQWDIRQAQAATDSYDFVSVDAAIYRFRIVAYIGSDVVATSNEFVIVWEEAVVNEYIYVYTPGEGSGSNDFDYVTEGTQITLYTPEYMGFTPIDGFTFDYWSIRKGTAQSAEVAQKQPGDQITIDDNTYIIAIWKEAPLTEYIYVYGPGDGQGSNDFDYATNGTEITLYTPEFLDFVPIEGFEFDYWSVRTGSAMGTEIAQKQPGETIIINDNTYIIAIWKAIPHTCVGVAESGQGATCTVNGWKDYYRCECGKYYEDADCETLIPDLEAWKLGDGKTTKDHEPNADDGDCTTAITCSVCGTVTTAANATHTAGADDGDCTTAVKCTKCDKNAIEANATHTGGTATCTQKAECTICGKEYGELAAHKYSEATCTAKAKCSVCGDEKGELAAHKPNADDGDCTTAITCSVCGTVTTAANATHTAGADDGDCTTAVKCTKCDKNAIEAKATHTGGTATCTQKAECTVCGKEYGELAAHKPNADDGDCTTDITCSVCGEVTTEGADSHTGGTATCEKKAECTVCGKEYGNLANHIPNADDGDCTTAITCSVCGTVTTAANATHTAGADDGDCTTAVKCTKCDKNAVEANATHTAGADDGDCTTAVKCTKCDKNAIEANATHTGGTATCTQKAECAVCGKEYGSFGNHDYGTLIGAVAEKHTQTELAAGVAAHYQCSVCDKYFTSAKVETTLQALTGETPSHSYGAWQTNDDKHWKECSCGLKSEENDHVYDDANDVTCNTCDHDRTLPHSHGNGVKQLGQSATCTVAGWNDYYKCSCGKFYTEADCTNEITDLAAWKTGAGKIEASHNYGTLVSAVAQKHTQTELVASVAAHYHCSACGKYFTEGKVETTLEALTGTTPSHSYGDWNTDTDKHWKECSCGKKANEGNHVDANSDNKCDTCDQTLSGGVTPPPHTHDYGTTWKSDGTNHWKECSCGDKKEVTAHSGGTATCEAKAKCSECNTEYGELAEHKYSEATCTAKAKCSVCGEETGELAAHKYSEATCTAKAKCSVCGEETGELAPHTPGADDGDCTTDITCSVCGEVTTKGADAHTGGTATCTAKATCSVCGKEYGELAAHKYSEATCTAKAKCSVCGDETGELAPHDYVDGKCECGATDPNYTPGTDEPGTDAPGTDAPGTDEPGTDAPGTDAPGTDDPGTDAPGTDAPGTDEPGTDAPGTDDPGTDAPGTDDPGTDDLGTDAPGTDKPEDPQASGCKSGIVGVFTGFITLAIIASAGIMLKKKELL